MSDKNTKAAATVSPDRLKAIVSKAPPSEYVSVGATGKRSPRKTVYKQGQLQLVHGERLPVVIRNLSFTGCRVEFFKQVRPSGRVLLTETSLPLELWAEVVWNADGACGLIFEDAEQVRARVPELSAPEIEPVRAMRMIPTGKKSRSTIRKRP